MNTQPKTIVGAYFGLHHSLRGQNPPTRKDLNVTYSMIKAKIFPSDLTLTKSIQKVTDHHKICPYNNDPYPGQRKTLFVLLRHWDGKLEKLYFHESMGDNRKIHINILIT